MRDYSLLRRFAPLAAIAAVVLAADTPTSGRVPFAPSITLTSGEPVSGGIVHVVSADDWATRTFNDPIDMDQRTDVSWWLYSDDQPWSFMNFHGLLPCTTTGSNVNPSTKCLKTTTTSDNNPNFFLLETGGPAEPVLGRTGDTYPINTTLYRRLTMRMRLGGAPQGHLLASGAQIAKSTMNFIWNEKTIYNSPAITTNIVWAVGDWAIYVVDLPLLPAEYQPGSPAPAWGAHTVRTLRVNPIRINGVPVEIDWVRLTPSAVQTSTFSWSGASSSGVDVYLDNDTSMANGNLGTLMQQNCQSTGSAGCPSTAIFNGAGLQHPTLRASSGSFTIPVGALAPGEYYVQVCSAGSTTDCTASSWRYRVNAPPTLAFLNPHPEGSTNDFATVQLNDAWDMTAMSDIDAQHHINNLRVATVNATAEDGSALGNVTVLRGTSLSSGATGDPYMYTLWFAGDGRGRFKKIDSDRYHIATVEMGIPNKRRDLQHGSVARLIWYIDGDIGENVSTDIVVNHTSGENTMAKFITSMKTLPLAAPQPGDPNPSPSRRGWTGQISNFRLDPHEFTPATDFYVKQIKLAANEVTINSQYTVRWTFTDPDGGNGAPTMTVRYDTDRNPDNGFAGTICTVNPATTSQCTWLASGVPFGAYHIHATYSDGRNTNTRYGDWPVLVGGDTVDPALKPRLVLDRRRVDFGGKYIWPSNAVTTPPQTVRVSVTGAGGQGVAWHAASNHPDIIVSPAWGTGDGDLTIAIRESNHYPANLVGDYTVTVTEFTPNATANSPQTIRVMFRMQAATATQAPFGSFDTPTNGQSGISGSVAVTGWALDDIGVDRVEIWRDAVPNDPAPPFRQPGHPADGKVFIGLGTSVSGSRPDVQAAFPGVPNNHRAGWGYLLLTWGFPGANGSFALTSIAWDVEGRHTVLGRHVITVNNSAATKPFGSIDVPAYGSTFSGHQWTFGWALSPNPNCSMSGGQLYMTMNSAPPYFPVTYGANRTDIAASFPGFRDSNNAGGAVALDSRNYPNGTHIIGWLVYDSCGNGEGIGSRFFTIQNSQSGEEEEEEPPAADALPDLATAYTTFAKLGLPAPRLRANPAPVRLARGFSSTPTSSLTTDRAGRRIVEVAPYDRIELHLPDAAAPAGQVAPGFEAYQVLDGELRALPLGSSFDAARGIFYWQPIPGFQGDFDFVFQRASGAAADTTPVHVRVTVGPAGH